MAGGCSRRRDTSLPEAPASIPATAADSPVASAASTLAVQNDLFASALAAKRRGDVQAELATLDRFLGAYPASPLAETAARRAHARTAGDGPDRASAAAREYLARYPNGFARADAEAILAEAP